MNTLSTIPDWYSLAQSVICAVGAVALFSVWSRTEKDRYGRDPCWLWLGNAVAAWACAGVAIYLLQKTGWTPQGMNIVRTVLSTLNSAFLLLAVAYIDYGPSKLKVFQAHPWWRSLVIGVGLAIAAFVGITGITFPDVMLSLLTLGLIGYALFASFGRRDFETLRWLSIGVVALTVVAQLPELDPRLVGSDIRFLLLLTSKTGLMLLFLCLSTTWLMESRESPHSEEIILEFTDSREADGWTVRLTLSQNKTLTGRIKGVPMRNLLLFAKKRLAMDGTGWLRLVDESLYAADLDRICRAWGIRRSSLFENDHQNGYRLRVLPERIKLPTPDWLERELG